MGYNREVYDAAMAELERRRTQAVAAAETARRTLTYRRPRLLEIEQEMSRAALRVSRAVLSGGDVEAAVDRIKNENLALQAEMASILAQEGYPYPNLEPHYTCAACSDTGYVNGRVCSCLQALLKEEACRQLSRLTSMRLTTFEEMELSLYPETPDPVTGVVPRRRMEQIISFCRQYAEDFGPHSENLLLRGPTGTGKTHVSLAVARTAAEKGYAVVYGPVQVLLHRLEKERFGRESGNSEEQLMEADLLVLDDIGTEFSNAFSISCLYNLINTRLLEQRPTILSTNLSQEQLREKYGDAIASRITGAYTPLLFCGRDIRQIRARK